MPKRQPREPAPAARDYRPPLFERLIALLGLALVSLVLAVLLYQTFRGGDGPPEVTVWPEPVIEQGELFLLPFRAENLGARTASAVRILGRLQNARGETLEQTEVEIDYIPAHSEQGGGLYFRQDPRRARLEIWAAGYVEP